MPARPPTEAASVPVADLEAAARAVIAALLERGTTLATAESLTGGWIGMALTTVPGASAVYRGGLIAYATDLKATLAGVHGETLDRDGPVAGTTAGELASGAAQRCAADWGLGVTGVAGPDPQDGHPVGQVFVGVAGPDRAVEVCELSLSGSRSEIRRQAVVRALLALLTGLHS
jgi:nicotinamide-nucleotide amidase